MIIRNRTGEAAQWLALIVFSSATGALFVRIHVPAALLLGPMLAAIAFAAVGATVRVSSAALRLAQGVIGCMIAGMAPPTIGAEILDRWPIFAFGVLAVIAASVGLGWVMTRMRVLPGTTILWGSSPGAATAMVVMADAYGADARLVAFMQYLRVALVTAIASIVAGVGRLETSSNVPTVTLFPPIHWLSFAETLALATLGPLIGEKLRIRSALLIPLVAGVFLVHHGWLAMDLPPWLLVLSYAAVGWSIGLRFTHDLLVYIARAFARVLACIIVLILICAALAAVLVTTAGIDPLTAYMATSPGGADSVAIIAASSHVDVPFVMAMQTLRLVAVIFLTPVMVKLVSSTPATGAGSVAP